jgi:hypothetical protein
MEIRHRVFGIREETASLGIMVGTADMDASPAGTKPRRSLRTM